MRVLILIEAAIFPPAHGGAKCMHALAEALSRCDHDVQVVFPVTEQNAKTRNPFVQSIAALQEHGIEVTQLSKGQFSHRGVSYIGIDHTQDFNRRIDQLLREREVDVLVVTEDSLQRKAALLAVLNSTGIPVAMFVWTVSGLPFGPGSAQLCSSALAQFQKVNSVFAPSEMTADYVLKWSGSACSAVRLPVFNKEKWQNLANQKGSVLMINPCAAKGMCVLLALINRYQSFQFKIVPGWGTTPAELKLLQQQSNVEVYPWTNRIKELFDGTSVVLFPSLVVETFPLVPIEAMLYGIPVLASNAGSVPDAMLGVPLVIPVNLLERVTIPEYNQSRTCWLTPPQDIGTWETALFKLKTNADYYQLVSQQATTAAAAYVESLSWDDVVAAIVAVPQQKAVCMNR